MTITIENAVITPVRAILNDPSPGSYWPDAELIAYYNMFVSVLLDEKPNALTKPTQFSLAAGVDQVLDDASTQFLFSPSNVASGRSIFGCTAEDLSAADPNWYGQPPTKDVEHVIPDKDDTRRFRVYPPNDGTGAIWISESYIPDDVTDLTDDFALSQTHRQAAIACVLGMAYAKNTTRGDTTKSAYWFGLMDQRIAQKVQGEMKAHPQVGPSQTTA